MVAVDFSSHSSFSCNYALELAIINNAEIMLFHTYNKQFYFSSPSMPDAYEISPFSSSDFLTDVEQNAIEQIESLKNEIAERAVTNYSKTITIETQLSKGDFYDDLCNFCDEYHPSVVILGSRGLDESKFLFGDTTIKVFNRLKYPVITMPAKEHSANISNVMYIADLEASNNLLIRKTFNLLEKNDPKIFCVHLAEDNNYLKAYSSKEYLTSEYQKEMNNEKFQCEVFEGSDRQEEIDSFIKKNDIDLIVFMPHKANFFQRLIGQRTNKKYLFETYLPILAIRS